MISYQDWQNLSLTRDPDLTPNKNKLFYNIIFGTNFICSCFFSLSFFTRFKFVENVVFSKIGFHKNILTPKKLTKLYLDFLLIIIYN